MKHLHLFNDFFIFEFFRGVAGVTLQRHHYQSRQYRVILQGHPVLSGLQAHDVERFAACPGTKDGSYQICQLLFQGTLNTFKKS